MTTSSSIRRADFRQAIAERRALFVAGVFNALSARNVEDKGFEALCLAGAGVTNMTLGMPDLAFIGLDGISEQTARIRDMVDRPLVVDADTDFGNALNVRRTIQVSGRCGADAVQLEDQESPQKCGHFEDKALVTIEQMVGKIRAAAGACQDENLQITRGPDAAATYGLAAAIERAHRYAEADADVLFIEAVEDRSDIERLPALFDLPLLLNILIGGKTPTLAQRLLAGCGYGVALYANAALQSVVRGMHKRARCAA